MKAPIAGGKATKLASASVPSSIAIDGTHVYWADFTTVISRVPILGGPPTPVASGPSPFAVVVDATRVYWTNVGTFASDDPDGSLMTAVK